MIVQSCIINRMGYIVLASASATAIYENAASFGTGKVPVARSPCDDRSEQLVTAPVWPYKMSMKPLFDKALALFIFLPYISCHWSSQVPLGASHLFE